MASSIFEIETLRNRTHVFRDRTDGGHVLASLLRNQNERSRIVLAIPSGGVPVALEMRETLKLPLDFMIVSKITFSWNREAGYGALAYDGTHRMNEETVKMLRMTRQEMDEGLEETKKKIAERVFRLRKFQPVIKIEGEDVILVDDGLASGITMEVAIEVARKQNAQRVAVAVPTGHEATVRRLGSAADAVYCANIRSGSSFAVADAYQEWHDVSDEELKALLA